MRIIENAKDTQPDTIICERCISGDEATYVVSSDVIHMRVCAACAEEARKLGLRVTTAPRVRERLTARSASVGLGSQMKLGKLLGAITACLAVCVIYMFRNCDLKPTFHRLN
jgi:hypothetical protein